MLNNNAWNKIVSLQTTSVLAKELESPKAFSAFSPSQIAVEESILTGKFNKNKTGFSDIRRAFRRRASGLRQLGKFKVPLISLTAVLLVGLAIWQVFPVHSTKNDTSPSLGILDRLISAFNVPVDKVIIRGNNQLSQTEVFDLLLLNRDTNIGEVSPAVLQKRLEKNGWIKGAQVRRQLSGQINIDIEERVPFSLWQKDGRVALIDAEGVEISSAAPASYAHLPLVVGIGAEVNAKALVEKLSPYPELATRIQSAVYVAQRRWDLILHNKLRILLPASDIEKALSDLSSLQLTERILDRNILVIDLRLADRMTLELPTDLALRRLASFPDGSKALIEKLDQKLQNEKVSQ